MKRPIQLIATVLFIVLSNIASASFPVKIAIPATNTVNSTIRNKEVAISHGAAKHNSFLHKIHVAKSLALPELHEGTLGTLALIFGILGLVGFFPGIFAAIILGCLGMKRHQAYAKTGFTLGIVGLCLCAFIVLIVFTLF